MMKTKMMKLLYVLLALTLTLSLSACANSDSESQSEPPAPSGENSPSNSFEPEHGLSLSDMSIKITSQGRTATFELYDTVAAEELYEQLPLELELTNFRDAQWMFYPPEELSVTAQEAYHDGKKANSATMNHGVMCSCSMRTSMRAMRCTV